MTLAPQRIPAPLCQEPDPEPREEADDDALIKALQARAWDPGLRFDHADVPVAWIVERYGKLRLARDRDDIVSYGSDGTVQLKAGTEEVTDYYADAPRGPLFPPISLSEVDKAERRIGRRLPELLRRVYTEVGNGGFGPDSGLASLTDGNRAPGHVRDWPCAAGVHERSLSEGMPPSWLFLTYGGCTMEWHVSLTAVDNPVLLYDTDGYTFGENPHEGLRHATASLRKWLRTWADGGDVWDEVL
ncbi:SMI1/KNR4 family protein [Streptomyces sp. NPDC001410]|uniref:SMI1/KNR4 family protein n=1 Tax=Streptomyces sp. NPDC001410 TaxID=3364574 RepID=UPI0036BF3FB5